MRATDLDLRELLAFEPEGGVLRFAGQRALLLDAVALGLLRHELIETLGAAGARAVLTRFGYAHGWRTAEVLRSALPWDDENEWRWAGGRLHTLQGLVVVEAPADEARTTPAPFAESIWHESYEAEQHLLHRGQAEEPTCWSLTGFASGYLSFAYDRAIRCLESRCRGKGDAVCHLIARPREEWGEGAAPELAFYEEGCLDTALATVTDQLKSIEDRLRSKRRVLSEIAEDDFDGSGMIVQSDEMKRVLDLARRVARVDSTVLLTGESGVGKERVARFIHDESARTAGPFVAINCGAVPETLLESELFGHVKGAFSGATRDRPGLFEAAHGGTLLLDEIGEVPPAMQVKLLRVLQEREVRRVGENHSRAVDVRVLAATNRDLPAEIHAARFRQDLYYRLRVVDLRIPPLRERRDDILPLARAFLAEAAARMGREVTGLSPAAAHLLVRHEWPGNVRELENAMERAVALARGNLVEVEGLPEEIVAASPSFGASGEPKSLAEVERDHILSVLRATAGNREEAASILGIGTATLYRRLKRYRSESGEGSS